MDFGRRIWYHMMQKKAEETVPMIGLRHFCREDAETVRSKTVPEMHPDEVEGMIADWNAGVFEGRYFEMFAVTKDGRIVGSASVAERSQSAVSFGIEIFPEEQGKGIAPEAMRLLSEQAKEKGYRAVLDQVRTDNAASIRLHEKAGFESDGYAYRNRRGHEVVLYLKLLY